MNNISTYFIGVTLYMIHIYYINIKKQELGEVGYS